jgi:hypothetical protein
MSAQEQALPYLPGLKIAAAVAVCIAIFLAGYFIPRLMWTKESALGALLDGTKIPGISLGNSRVPCRGPDKKYFVFGYTMAIGVEDKNGSGSVCWDVFNSKWEWRVDPPYERFSSDRPPEERGAGFPRAWR